MRKIIPGTTAPFAQQLLRSHSPTGAYRRFRPCLRWEFGFTCAICLLHERDFVFEGTGAQGTGQTGIEHFVARSIDHTRENDYSNCLYVCKFCNGMKSDTPTRDPSTGRTLLNPMMSAWADHFKAEDDELKALTENAEYTRDSYQINHVMRTTRRSARRRRLENLYEMLENRLRDMRGVEGELRDPSVAPNYRQEKLSQWGRWRKEALSLHESLRESFSGIPQDHDVVCSCAAARAVPPGVSAGWRDPPIMTVPDQPPGQARRFRT